MSLLLLLLEPLSAGVEITNNANTTVNHLGASVYTVEKTSGAAGFNASAVSSAGITGDFVLRVKHTVAASSVFLGMNADPLTDNDFASIDYAWSNPGPTFGQIYESGSLITTLGGGTYHWIWRTGTTLGFGRGPDIATAQASPDRTVTTSATLHFDSSLHMVGDKAEVLLYEVVVTLTDVSGTSSLAFAAGGSVAGRGDIAASAGLNFAPTGSLAGRGSIAGSSSLAFAPSASLIGRGNIAGTAALAFAGAGSATGVGAVAGSAGLVFSPSGAISGVGGVSGASSLVFASGGDLAGLGAVFGDTSLGFSLAGLLELPQLWAVVPPAATAYASSDPDAGSWSTVPPASPAFANATPNAGTWTEVSPNTGTWN